MPILTSVPRNNWTRQQTLAALHLYLQLPFGQLHQRNPKLIQLAQWIDRTPGAVALKLVNLASLDPLIVSSGRSGMANASGQDRQLWAELQTNWDAVALAAAAEYERLATGHGVDADKELLDEILPIEEGRTRAATVQVRVNQARFRRAVLTSYGAACCISGLQSPQLLVASHIVPWSEDTKNRLNPQNGLCLSALHDRAYDQGLLTVLPDLTIRVSPALLAKAGDSFLTESVLKFDGQRIRSPERFAPAPVFLEHHSRRFGYVR